MSRTRAQIHEGKKIALRYRDEQGRDSERTIWPIAMGYLEAVRGSGGMGVSCAGIFAVFEPTGSSTPNISMKNTRSGATSCGRDGEGAWSGNSRAIPDRLRGQLADRFIPR